MLVLGAGPSKAMIRVEGHLPSGGTARRRQDTANYLLVRLNRVTGYCRSRHLFLCFVCLVVRRRSPPSLRRSLRATQTSGVKAWETGSPSGGMFAWSPVRRPKGRQGAPGINGKYKTWRTATLEFTSKLEAFLLNNKLSHYRATPLLLSRRLLLCVACCRGEEPQTKDK